MEKIFEGAISCKALLEAGSRNCKKLYIDKKRIRKIQDIWLKLRKVVGAKLYFVRVMKSMNWQQVKHMVECYL